MEATAAHSPFDLFLCSVATCMGVYALNFGEKHGLSSEDLTLDLKSDKDPESGLVQKYRSNCCGSGNTLLHQCAMAWLALLGIAWSRDIWSEQGFDILVK